MWLAPWQTTVSLREGLPQHCLICTASFFEIGRVVREIFASQVQCGVTLIVPSFSS